MRTAMRALLLLSLVAGCKEKGLGLPCLLTPIFCETMEDCPLKFNCASATATCVETGGATSNTYDDDALECPSTICLQMLGSQVSTCTERCENNDDCAEGDTSSCRNENGEEAGYVCVQPIPIPPDPSLGCDFLCVCRWEAERQKPPLYSSDGGVAIPPRACAEAK